MVKMAIFKLLYAVILIFGLNRDRKAKIVDYLDVYVL